MKVLMSSICTTALVCAGTLAAAQDKSAPSKQSQEVQQETTTSNAKGSAKVKTDTVRGKIESFEPGKTIKVTVPGKTVSTKSWRLGDKGWTYHIASNLKPNDWVTVIEKTGGSGHKTLTIQRSSNQGTASRIKTTPYR